MAKAILEFYLNEPDDVVSHLRAVKSLDMASALHEIIYNTKKRIKNEIEFSMKDKCSSYEAVDLVFDNLHKILEEYDIDIDKLIN